MTSPIYDVCFTPVHKISCLWSSIIPYFGGSVIPPVFSGLCTTQCTRKHSELHPLQGARKTKTRELKFNDFLKLAALIGNENRITLMFWETEMFASNNSFRKLLYTPLVQFGGYNFLRNTVYASASHSRRDRKLLYILN